MKVALLGLGQVGKSLLKLLRSDHDSPNTNSEIRLVLAVDSSQAIFSQDGIDPERLLHHKEKGDIRTAGYSEVDRESIFEHDFDVLIDLMPATPDGVRARDLYLTAFENGRNVITACKSGLANHWTRIMEECSKKGMKISYEATVAGGLPFFSFMNYCLRSSNVVSLQAIVNSSANFILKRSASGISLEKSLEEARSEGILETDYHFDTRGFDSAWKTVIIANSIFGQSFSPADVSFEGVEEIVAEGKVDRYQRLVSSVSRTGSLVEATSRITTLAENDPLLNLGETGLGFTVKLDNRTPLTVTEMFDGPTDTASAVLNDLFLSL